jgi:hypothetical protein
VARGNDLHGTSSTATADAIRRDGSFLRRRGVLGQLVDEENAFGADLLQSFAKQQDRVFAADFSELRLNWLRMR